MASLAAVLGTALVPALGSTPAGATGTAVTVVTGHSGATAPSLGIPAPEASAQISPTYVAYDPSNGDTAVAQTKAGSVFVYLIAGASESNEYNIQTAPSPSPAFGSLTAGDAYLVAGTGTAGLIAEPGNNQFGNSTTAVATSNPISPTSVAFDPNGNLLIAGEFGTDSAIQVVAKTTGTFYGVAMTAGDLYTIADVGVSGAPSSAINMGDVAAPSDGISVDPSGNIVVGDGDGVEFVNETSGSLTLYGQSIAAQSSTVIAGTAQGNTDCTAGATTESALAEYFQSPEPYIDSSDNVYLSDNETGPTSGCDWVLPAQSGTLDGMSVTAGNVYKLAGNGGTTSTPDGTAGVQSNVAGTSQMALDGAGNVVLALTGAATGTSPALRVLAESSATYYGVAMTAGDIYTVAGGSSNLLATLSHPTSLLNIGSGNLLFTDGSSSSANLDQFSGAPTGATPVPAVTGISPSSGPTAGGTGVTIMGSNLSGQTAVDFGSTPGTVTADSATSITVTSPAESAGTVDVTVTTPNGTSATSSADQYTYAAAPTVTAVNPTSGPQGGGTSVTVTGSNLANATAVKFGSTAGTVTADTATSITVTSPPGTGTQDVTVTTAGGTSATSSADHFTYTAAPTVTVVSPSAGPVAGGTTVTITGTNLTGQTAVDFGSTAGTVTADTGTTITVTAPAESAGTVDVTVTTPIGTSATSSADHFTYDGVPTVTAVSPNAGPLGGTTGVTITGTNLTGQTAVDFGASAGTVTADTGTTITVNAPAESAATVDVTVTTPGGTSATSSNDHFTYTAAPTVSAVSPNAGPLGGTTGVTITGTNLTGQTAVDFGSSAGTVTADTGTTITVNAPAESAATVDVRVTTAGGTSATSSADHFTYDGVPTVTAVSPNAGPLGGTTGVTITGTNLTGQTAVDFGASAGTVTADTGTTITVNAPAESAATVDVTVTTPGGTSAISSNDHFTYTAAPTVGAVSPTSGPGAGGTSVTVTGTNMANATAVKFGTTAGTVTADTGTSITVTSPAGVGTVDVTVTTPGGTSATSNVDQFTYIPGPTINALSPSVGPAAGGTSVTVSGTNLADATAVDFGSTAGTITADTGTSITVTSPAGEGTVDVTVTTPGGTSPISSADQFSYPPNVSGATEQAGGVSSSPTGTATAALPGSPSPTTASASGVGALTVAQYSSNPTGGAVSGGTGVYYDVKLATGSDFSSVTITVCALGAGGQSISWWNGSTWLPFSSQSFSSSTGCVTATVNGSTSPTLAQLTGTPIAATVPAPAGNTATAPAGGYWSVASDGGIFSYGDANFHGSTGGTALNKPIVGMASTPSGNGYWLVASDGGIFAYGDATFYGSTGGMHLNQPIVGMASTPSGNGYWLVASDGGIFSYGDATFYGSTGGLHLNKPIVGMASTPSGNGYWLVASDGGIFSYGDATFYGSTGGMHLNKPIVGMASTPSGNGYWLVASDGGIFNYGDAVFAGSAGATQLNKPIVGIAPTASGKGYWLVASDGGIFNYGDAVFDGSAGGLSLNKPIVGIAAHPESR